MRANHAPASRSASPVRVSLWTSPMIPPRLIAPLQIAVRIMQPARDMFFNSLGRDTEPLRNLLVGTVVKYPQRKCRTALRWQSIDGLLYKPIAFVPEQLCLQ